MVIDKQRVFDLRNEGKTMFEIASDIWDADHKDVTFPNIPLEKCSAIITSASSSMKKKMDAVNARTFWIKRRKQIEDKYLYSKGGVYDILMIYPDQDYDHDGGVTLIGSIILSAIEDYGMYRTEELLGMTPNGAMPTEKEYTRAKAFFFSKDYENCMDCLSTDNKYPKGYDMLVAIDKDVLEGRWIGVNSLRFKTKKEATEFINKYKFLRESCEVLKDRNVWRLRRTI